MLPKIAGGDFGPRRQFRTGFFKPAQPSSRKTIGTITEPSTGSSPRRAGTKRQRATASHSPWLVAAGTGNGTLHADLEAALIRAQAAGVKIVRATGCAHGRVVPHSGGWIADSNGLSPVKARVTLMLALLGAPSAGSI